jgi:hypothetical protein
MPCDVRTCNCHRDANGDLMAFPPPTPLDDAETATKLTVAAPSCENTNRDRPLSRLSVVAAVPPLRRPSVSFKAWQRQCHTAQCE